MSDRKQLVKLQIRSFGERSFSASSEDTDREFCTPINPETFSQTYKVNADTQQGHGNQATETKYKSTAPEELRLEFILDGTLTVENYGGERAEEFMSKTVHEQLADLKRCVYDMDGTIHRPRFLIVQWGTELSFKSVLSNLELNYTLFEPDGSPLRIKVNATFLAHKSREEIAAEARKTSPDLTHYRQVKQDDRLDLMTYKIYNDSKYFMQAAKVNRLITLRRIKPGKELYFPPFDKNET